MNKKLMFLIMALALVSAPGLATAQYGPGPEEEEEIEMMDDGPGMGRGQMGPGMGQGKMGPRSQMGGDRERMMIKKKMALRGGDNFFGEEKALEVIKKHDPAFAAKLAELRESAPAKYKMAMQMSGKLLGAARLQKDEAAEKDAVRALALEFESKELSLRYNKASDTEKKAIKDKLKAVLGELFDLKNKGQEMRVKHMEGEISRLKSNLEKRKASKSKIVDQRLEQLTGEGYGW